MQTPTVYKTDQRTSQTGAINRGFNTGAPAKDQRAPTKRRMVPINEMANPKTML